jgi:hypothetical protein
MPRLAITAGSAKGQEWQLRQGVNLVGRAEGVDFFLNSPAVSGRHCEIVVTDFSVRVRDLGSTNGTCIDGKPVRDAEIKDGQMLKLRDVTMRLTVEPVQIAIPDLPAPERLPPAALPDGTLVCYNHSEVPATLRCVQCGNTYCEACVKELRLVGGKPRSFCPACSGSCQALGPARRTGKARSFGARLLETIRLSLRRGRSRK